MSVQKRIKYRCPNCGSDSLSIEVRGWCHVAQDEDENDFHLDGPNHARGQDYYDDNSIMACDGCNEVKLPARSFIVKGWDLFESDRGWEIERDDEANVFDSDEDALTYICEHPEEVATALNEITNELLRLGKELPSFHWANYSSAEFRVICNDRDLARRHIEHLISRLNES